MGADRANRAVAVACACLLSALGAGLLEWVVWVRGDVAALLTVLSLWQYVGLAAAAILGALAAAAGGCALLVRPVVLPAGGEEARAQRAAGGEEQHGHEIKSSRRWFVFYLLLLLAFVPFPLFLVVGKVASTIDDTWLLVRFVAAGAVLAVGGAVVVCAGLAWPAARLTVRVARLRSGPSAVTFWLLSFPLPWLVVPFAVTAWESTALAPAGRPLLPALFVLLVPPLALAAARLGRVRPALPILTGAVLAGAVGLAVLSASGAVFQPAAAGPAPFSSMTWSLLRSAADFDGDGQAALFEGMDCDEADPEINAAAYDLPDNGVDEDCDGEDAVETEDLRLGGAEPFPFAEADRYNVVIVLMDALRADHLKLAGYRRVTAPNLERLAGDSLAFTHVQSQYPTTGISIPSLLAGVYPEYMKWRKPNHRKRFVIGRENVLLPDILEAAGYQTAAALVPWVADNVVGLAARFQSTLELYPPEDWRSYVENSSPVTATRAIELLEELEEDKPFFLFLHFEEPHRPYVNHPAPGRTFGRKAADRYDSDIYWADLWLGFLLGYMEERGFLEDTIVIVTADHGEEFSEHGRQQHGRQLYQESIRVPIIISAPGLEPQVVESPVALVDIVPTVLDLTGIDHPRGALQGVSLLAAAAGRGDAADRPIFSMVADRERRPTRHCKAVLQGGFKYLRDLSDGKEELYDLGLDPREKKNRIRNRAEVAAELRAALDSFLAGADASWKIY